MDPNPTIRPVSARALARLLGDWRSGRGALYELLGRRVAQLLVDGRLATGTRVPAERNLARELGISRNTAARAYGWLREHGMLTSRQGSGSVTSLGDASALRRVPWSAGKVRPQDGDLIDLTMASGPPPPEVLAVLQHVVDRAPAWLDGHGYHPLGLPALCEAVAARYAERGLPTRPQQVMITSGAQHALDLLARLLVRRGDVALVESPTYPGALDVLRATGARLVSFDVAHAGWQPAQITALAGQTQARVAYLVPDFQNPTGRLMPDAARVELMDGLRRHPVTVIADETLVDLALEDDARARPLSAPDGASSVLSVGSLSKVVWGGLRVGWVRGPERVISALATLRTTSDIGGPVVDQAAAVELLARLDEIAASRRLLLRAQRDVLLERLTGELGWEATTPTGGLSVWAKLPAGSSSTLAEVAPRFGLLLAAGPRLSPDGALDGFLRIPFARPLDVLAEATERLALAYRHVLAGTHAEAGPLV